MIFFFKRAEKYYCSLYSHFQVCLCFLKLWDQTTRGRRAGRDPLRWGLSLSKFPPPRPQALLKYPKRWLCGVRASLRGWAGSGAEEISLQLRCHCSAPTGAAAGRACFYRAPLRGFGCWRRTGCCGRGGHPWVQVFFPSS